MHLKLMCRDKAQLERARKSAESLATELAALTNVVVNVSVIQAEAYVGVPENVSYEVDRDLIMAEFWHGGEILTDPDQVREIACWLARELHALVKVVVTGPWAMGDIGIV